MILSQQECSRRFLERMVHDFREGLRSVSTATELLRAAGSPVEEHSALLLQEVMSGTSRLQTLIDGVSAYSSAMRTPSQVAPAPLEIGLRAALAKLKAVSGAPYAEITNGALPRVAFPIEVSTCIFQQLIGNALKFRSDEIPRIQVSAIQAPDKRDTGWIVTVEDNGIGLEPQYLESVFEPFVRIHPRRYPGAGMGLAICKQLVQSHGGRIWAERTAGGSRFRFSVPAA